MAETQKTMIEGGSHRGITYFIELSKTDNKYKARATIAWLLCSEIIDFNEEGMIDLVELKRGTVSICRGNHSFYENPFQQCQQFTIGHIDAILGMAGTAERLTKENANDFSNEELRQVIAYHHHEESMLKKSRMKPETDPTPEQLEQMKGEVERLIKTFSVPGLSALTKISGATIAQWRERGRISAQAAHEICQLKQISAHEFTRERLRPDVAFWYVDHN